MLCDNTRKLLAMLAALASTQLAFGAGQLVTFLPTTGLAGFIVSEWDIRTMSSSINPRRKPEQAHFSEVGLKISKTTDERVVLDGPDDTFVIQVLKRGDANNDGIEDVMVCFSESAKAGTLASSRPLVLQKYSETTPLVALAYAVHDGRCQ
jgi:hypothetical protein